jgi:hypothetical protein
LHRSPTFINQIIIARLSITIIIKNLFWNFSPFLHEFIFIQPPKKCKFEMLLHFLISIFQNCFCLVFIVNKQQWERRSKYLTFYFVNKSNAFDDYFSETKNLLYLLILKQLGFQPFRTVLKDFFRRIISTETKNISSSAYLLTNVRISRNFESSHNYCKGIYLPEATYM